MGGRRRSFVLPRGVAAGLSCVALIGTLSAACPARGSEPEEPVPSPALKAPYVRGGSRWVYRSNFGTAVVTLEETGASDDALRYLWTIRLLGVGMSEQLELRPSGLYVMRREFSLPGGIQDVMWFPGGEVSIEAPLEVGHSWNEEALAAGAGGSGTSVVHGLVEALEEVRVPAGTFTAFRIRLTRSDTWGSRLDATLWLDPMTGVVRAAGDLRWPGVAGRVQDALGLDHLEVSLEEVRLRVR